MKILRLTTYDGTAMKRNDETRSERPNPGPRLRLMTWQEVERERQRRQPPRRPTVQPCPRSVETPDDVDTMRPASMRRLL